MIEKLKKLGLTGYESQAYLALLKLGYADADEIAQQNRKKYGTKRKNKDRFSLSEI